MTIITRVAPSPTGIMHVGTARTALYNWLAAKSQGGEFRLRIEDTDRARSDASFIYPIIQGLKWLGLDHDGEIVHQSDRADRHVEIANAMVDNGSAYRDYTTPDEMEALRTQWAVRHPKTPFRYLDNPWRDGAILKGLDPYVVRLKAPRSGETIIQDLVQGEVKVSNSTLDDMILLRSDGTPTYMLAVVVDDHDAGVTHIARGDDHLSNTFRQIQIYRSMGWREPTYAHMPLILDETGKKLSKRHGSAGLSSYEEAGYLPDAVFNYLLRMGWGSGDHEIVSREDALRLFSLSDVGRAPSRLDPKRLDHLNGVYIRNMTDWAFGKELFRFICFHGNDSEDGEGYDDSFILTMSRLLKERVKTLREAANYIEMTRNRPKERVSDENLSRWYLDARKGDFTAENLRNVAQQIADETGVKLKHVVAPIRMAIFGSKVSPPLFETMVILGVDEVQERIQFAIAGNETTRPFTWDYSQYRRLDR